MMRLGRDAGRHTTFSGKERAEWPGRDDASNRSAANEWCRTSESSWDSASASSASNEASARSGSGRSRHSAASSSARWSGEKSISIDSLYKVSVSLAVPLGQLTNVARSRRTTVPSKDAEKIFALVSGRHPAAKLRRAHDMLRAMLDKG